VKLWRGLVGVVVPVATVATAATGSGCALAEDWSTLQSGTSSAYEALVLKDGAVALFPLHDPAGSDLAKNLAGSQGPGSVLNNGVTFDGQAATFSGGYIGLGSNFEGMTPFMIEAWIRVDEEPSKPMVLFSDAADGLPYVNGYQVLLDQGGMGSLQLSAPVSTLAPAGATCSASFSYTIGQSVYLVFEYAPLEGMNDYNLIVYSNTKAGESGDCGNSAAGRDPTTTQTMVSLQLGDAADTIDVTKGLVPFSGVVSEVAVYDSPLQPSQIQAHYATGMSGP
jgi:hypothetical protein